MGPIEPGGAVAMIAGRVPNERVIHAALRGFRGGSMIPASAETVYWAAVSALEVADREGMRSITFPARGTGAGGFDLVEFADIMVGIAREKLSATNEGIQ